MRVHVDDRRHVTPGTLTPFDPSVTPGTLTPFDPGTLTPSARDARYPYPLQSLSTLSRSLPHYPHPLNHSLGGAYPLVSVGGLPPLVFILRRGGDKGAELERKKGEKGAESERM